MHDLTSWTLRPLPVLAPMEGRFVRLEPLDPAIHGDGLFEASSTPDAGDRFRYLSDSPPVSRAEFDAWMERALKRGDPLFFVVIDRATFERPAAFSEGMRMSQHRASEQPAPAATPLTTAMTGFSISMMRVMTGL
jgi:hypothetical protein